MAFFANRRNLFGMGVFVVMAFLSLAAGACAMPAEMESRLISSQSAAELQLPVPLSWSTDYSGTLEKAKQEGKGVLLAFVGPHWCPWSHKLYEDVLKRADFVQAMQREALLVYVDFPSRTHSSAQAEPLRQQYEVYELPMLVLITAEGREICKLGYLPLHAEEFARHINGLFSGYKEIDEAIRNRDLVSYSSEKLQALYVKARSLGCNQHCQKILTAALAQDRGLFFLLERYAQLVEQRKQESREGVSLRRSIVASDPKNEQGAQLRLALLDFQGNTHMKSPKKAIEPLLTYLKQFGKGDPENTWRVEMTVAQFLFSKNKKKLAIQHAKASYDAAPEAMKAEIAKTIEYLKK